MQSSRTIRIQWQEGQHATAQSAVKVTHAYLAVLAVYSFHSSLSRCFTDEQLFVLHTTDHRMAESFHKNETNGMEC